METTILIILAASIGYINNINRSTEYALNMEDGSKEHVILKKNMLNFELKTTDFKILYNSPKIILIFIYIH